MSVVEWPVFVVSLEDLEIVSFERVMHGLRAFDMTIVFRDFSRPVRTITSVPVDSMDTIKKWLNEMDIVWYESKTPLNWPFILKTIRQDVEGFIREGGFSFLDDGGSEKDPQKATQLEDEDEEDEDYDESMGGSLDAVTEESEEESEEEESDASSDDSDEDDDDDDDSEVDSEGSDDEEGLEWDELEKRARNDDRKRGVMSDDEDDKRRKKRRVK